MRRSDNVMPWWASDGNGCQLHLQNPTGMEAGLVDRMRHQHLQRAGTVVTADVLGGLLSSGERANGDVGQSRDVPTWPLGGDCGGHMYGVRLFTCGDFGQAPGETWMNSRRCGNIRN